MIIRLLFAAVLAPIALTPGARDALAGDAHVIAARAAKAQDGSFRFVVSVRHGDEGDHHYADRWEVMATDGTVLATRVLRHPHVGEQPFARALAGVRIPAGTQWVRVRAHDNVHGYGGAEIAVKIPP